MSGKQWDAKFSGCKRGFKNKTEHEPRSKNRITVFAITRDEAVEEIKKAVSLYGYDFVTIEHISKN